MIDKLSFGTLIIRLRQSRVDIKITLCKFKAMEDPIMLLLLVLTQDGGNFSSMKERISRISKTTKFLMSKVAEIMKVKPFGVGRDITVKISSGMLHMLMK
jgi:hypothetical protein